MRKSPLQIITSITHKFRWDLISIVWLQWTIAKNTIARGPFWSKVFFLIFLGSFLVGGLLTILYVLFSERPTFNTFPRNPILAQQLASIFTAIAMLLFLINGSISARTPPFNLSIADALFLIAGPIDFRVLTFSITFRRLLRWLIMCLTLLIGAPSIVPSQIGNDLGLGSLLLAVPGLAIFVGILITWRLFVYITANRLRLISGTPWLCRILTVTLLTYLVINIRTSKNAWASLVNFGNAFPFLQWMLSPLWPYLQGGIEYVPLLILLSIFLLLFITLAILPIPIEPFTRTAFEVESLIEQINRGEIGTLLAKQLPQRPVTSFKRLIFLQGSLAFIWRQIAELNKEFSRYIRGLVYSFIGMSILLYIWPQLSYIAVLLILFLGLSSTLSEGFFQEKTSPYWHLVPGTTKKKIVIVSILPATFLLLDLIALWTAIALFGPLPKPLLFGILFLLPFLSFLVQMIGVWTHLVVGSNIYSYVLFMSLFNLIFGPSVIISFGLLWCFCEIGLNLVGILVSTGLLFGLCLLFLSLSIQRIGI